MKKYIRAERANLFEPNVYISMIVKIEGVVTKEDIRKAVERAYKANEATMSKIVLEDNGNAYYETMERSGCKFFSGEGNWRNLINESEKTPFAIHQGELVRVFATEENQQIVLLIHAHHLVGDGKSILILVGDIVKSLAGEALTYKPMLLADRNFLEKRARLMPGIKLAIKKVNQKWEKVGKTFTWDDYYLIHKKYWEEHSSRLDVQTFRVEEIKAQCKNNVTINSFLISGLLKKYPERKTVGIPVSIREEDAGMSNQTSGIAIKYQYNPRISFEKNSIKFHKKIYKKIKNEAMKYFVLLFMEQLSPSLIDAVLLQTHACYQNKLAKKMAKVMGYIGKKERDLGVTNLNIIDIKSQYGNFRIEDILFVPPKVSYAKCIFGISTYGDKLTVAHHKMM